MLYSSQFLLLVTALLFSNTPLADTLQGRVICVTDGDTVTILDASNTQLKIRLMGIDAPEKKQPFGSKSKESLSTLIFDKQVIVEFRKRDKYGRLVGKIVVNGVDANLEQVKAGMAWHYKQFIQEQTPDDRAIYSKAEEQARNERAGLWIDPAPIPPWNWRHARKNRK